MVELADIFRQHGFEYQQKYGHQMLTSHSQVMQSIQQCRTEALGGHVYYCPNCEETVFSYHSCRNRHCPKCQNNAAQHWLEKQQDMLLPVPYFLLTFTLPDGLRRFARSNQKLVYNMLFRASAAATQKLAQDSRFIGGQIGMIGVLHTWGRNLAYHPHVHYLVPAGGLTEDEQTWLPTRKKFLVPVKALSKLVRAKFRDALRKQACFADVPVSVWKQDWVVYCQPVGNGEGALKYLAPYIFRVAISNNRILKLADRKVTFRYKDTNTGKTKCCTLFAEEFIRRFLQHVLPKGFVKVRYYGFFSPGLRPRLATLREKLNPSILDEPSPEVTQQPDIVPTSQQENGPHTFVRCPSCGQPLHRQRSISPLGCRPP